MAVHVNRKGLDLPLAGAPAAVIAGARPSPRVALLAADSIGLKPAMFVQPGERVRRGQKLYEDKRTPGIAYTSPAAGTVAAIHRGERRSLISVVIDVDAGDGPDAQFDFAAFSGRAAADLNESEVRALLVESGLWTALRTRPFSHVPAADAGAEAIFVTATDTRPHAPDPAPLVAARAAEFRDGLVCLSRLASTVYLCTAAGQAIDAPAGVRVEQFSGPHPSGNVGWHIHRLHPVSFERRVWHIGCQDAIAIGHLVRTGKLDVERVISLAGPSVRQPRLLRTRLGASVDSLVAGELSDGEQRVISGSVLDGRAAMGEIDGYLGRYHLQVAALPEGRTRRMFGWIAPGADRHSVTGAVLGAFRRAHRFALSTATHGGERAMVPIGSYERVLPFDMLPTFLLRALITRDDLRAQELGALELDEDDLALATYVCPGKTEYGPLLRAALTRIEKEHG